MVENDISPFFVLKKIRDGEELRMDQKHIKIRMNSDKVMAIHYKFIKIFYFILITYSNMYLIVSFLKNYSNID